MKYEVTISELAQSKIDAIFEYLEQDWSEKVKENFREKLYQQVNFLRENPLMFPISQKMGIRKCIITKHNTLYYKISDNEVQIITIHDNRSNPKSLKI